MSNWKQVVKAYDEGKSIRHEKWNDQWILVKDFSNNKWYATSTRATQQITFKEKRSNRWIILRDRYKIVREE